MLAADSMPARAATALRRRPKSQQTTSPPHCPSPAHLLVTPLGQGLCPAIFSTKFFFKSRGECPACRSRVGYSLSVRLRHVLVVSGADLGTQKGTADNATLLLRTSSSALGLPSIP